MKKKNFICFLEKLGFHKENTITRADNYGYEKCVGDGISIHISKRHGELSFSFEGVANDDDNGFFYSDGLTYNSVRMMILNMYLFALSMSIPKISAYSNCSYDIRCEVERLLFYALGEWDF